MIFFQTSIFISIQTSKQAFLQTYLGLLLMDPNIYFSSLSGYIAHVEITFLSTPSIWSVQFNRMGAEVIFLVTINVRHSAHPRTLVLSSSSRLKCRCSRAPV